MYIKIYDYDNNAEMVEIPDNKKIESIDVTVLSGDETGYVFFTDGSKKEFDASDCRIMSFDDGSYIVPSKKVNEWINWEPHGLTNSYTRQSDFCHNNEED